MTLDTNTDTSPVHAPDSGVVIEVHGAQMPVSFSPVRLTISDAAIARLEAAIEGMRAKGLVVESLTQ